MYFSLDFISLHESASCVMEEQHLINPSRGFFHKALPSVSLAPADGIRFILAGSCVCPPVWLVTIAGQESQLQQVLYSEARVGCFGHLPPSQGSAVELSRNSLQGGGWSSASCWLAELTTAATGHVCRCLPRGVHIWGLTPNPVTPPCLRLANEYSLRTKQYLSVPLPLAWPPSLCPCDSDPRRTNATCLAPPVQFHLLHTLQCTLRILFEASAYYFESVSLMLCWA